MTRAVMPLYAMVLVVAMLAAGVGFKLGRYYPHDAGFMHLFHQEPSVFDWVRHPV